MVFGGSGVGSSGDISLSSLNGTNGFKLDGENNNTDRNGISVSVAGDINGDGIMDLLIGAIGYPGNFKGRTYVIFGDVPPVLINNTLTLYAGEVLQLTPEYLAAYDRNHNNATLVFIPSNISHGYFSTLSAPTTPLVNFTLSQITNDSIQFVHDGSAFAPSYEITVRSTGIAWTGPVAANITFVILLPPPSRSHVNSNSNSNSNLNPRHFADYFTEQPTDAQRWSDRGIDQQQPSGHGVGF